MQVTIVFLARAGQVVGKHLAKLELPEKATIEDLLEEIDKKISKRFYRGVKEGRLVFTIIVNGKPVDEPGYRLKDGDRVVFTTPEMGG